jgi:putative ABC transport system permease protein
MRAFRRVRSLRHARLQLALVVAALSVAVTLPVLLLSVGDGVSSHELHALETSGFQISVSAPGTHGVRGAHAAVARLLGIPGVSAVSPALAIPIDLFPPGGGPIPLLAEGVLPGPFLATLPPEESALFPHPLPLGDPNDTAHYANGTYLGPASSKLIVSGPIAAADHLRVGESVTLAATNDRSAGTTYSISGLFATPPALLGPTAAFAAILPLSELQSLAGLGRNLTGALLDAADDLEVAVSPASTTAPGAVDRIAAEIQAAFPYYAVSTQSQTVAQAENAAAILQGFYVALSSVSLAVGLLFLALILVRRVDTRRPVLAVERAIGVPATMIAGGIAWEALLLACAGVVGGLVLGFLVITLLATYGSAGVQTAAQFAIFDPVTLLALAGAMIGLALLASLWATRAALRIPIPEAIR